jgi:hypothetical protein
MFIGFNRQVLLLAHKHRAHKQRTTSTFANYLLQVPLQATCYEQMSSDMDIDLEKHASELVYKALETAVITHITSVNLSPPPVQKQKAFHYSSHKKYRQALAEAPAYAQKRLRDSVNAEEPSTKVAKALAEAPAYAPKRLRDSVNAEEPSTKVAKAQEKKVPTGASSGASTESANVDPIFGDNGQFWREMCWSEW